MDANIEQLKVKGEEQHYLDAIKKYEELVRKDPDRYRYNVDLGDSYNNAGNFYYNLGQLYKGEQYYLNAIRISEELAKKDPNRYNATLVDAYIKAGRFYSYQLLEVEIIEQCYITEQYDKAEQYYLEAIGIYERLAKENPDRYNENLADSYGTIGNFYYHGESNKAEQYYLKAIKIREKLAKKDPDRYNATLAMSYFNYGIFKNNYTYQIKAYELALTNPTDSSCSLIIKLLNG